MYQVMSFHYVCVYIYRYGWLVEATHGSSHSPRTQPPPADLRVSSEDVIADPPRQFLVVRLPKKRKPVLKEQNPMTASQKPPAHTASPLFQKKTKAVSDTVSYIVIVLKGQGFTSPSDSDITKVFSGNRSRL